jgi:outer membrane protein with beta-barrel domain
MRSFARIVSAAAAIAGTALVAPLAAPLAAQSSSTPTASVFHVAPYAGYMVFGNYLNGPVGTTLSSKPGALYGVQAALSLSQNLQLVGNIGTTSSSMQVGVPFLGGLSVGNSSMLMYDADLEYDFGNSSASGMKFTPFIQAGIGQMKYDISASVLETHATNMAENVGLGADVAIGRGMAVRLLAKDYIGKFNFQDATGLGITGSTAHNLGFMAGLRFDF